jgi:hypothetical protein
MAAGKESILPTLTEVPLALDLDLFLEVQGDALRRPELREVAGWAVREAQALIAPALSYRWLPVVALGDKRVKVGEAGLNLGRHAGLLDEAVEAIVGVATIGPALEERAREISAQGRALDGFVLGEVGVFAVGLLARRLHGMAEEEAARRGWGVGAELAPGQLAGWDIAEQRLICGLLDLESIGVRVTPSGLLVPQKSVSIMVGIGPGYQSAEVRSPCEYCERGGTCRWRH